MVDTTTVVTILKRRLSLLSQSPGHIPSIEEAEMDVLRMWTRRCLTDECETACAKHPLGFLYLNHSIGEGQKLRYHVWLPDWTVPRAMLGGEIHEHSYDLMSTVLLGRLQNQNFALDLGSEDRYRMARVSYGPDGSRATLESDHVPLGITDSTINSTGTSYFVKQGVLHRTIPKSLPIVTLALSIPNVNGQSTLAIPDGIVSPPLYQISPPSSEEIRALAEILQSF